MVALSGGETRHIEIKCKYGDVKNPEAGRISYFYPIFLSIWCSTRLPSCSSRWRKWILPWRHFWRCCHCAISSWYFAKSVVNYVSIRLPVLSLHLLIELIIHWRMMIQCENVHLSLYFPSHLRQNTRRMTNCRSLRPAKWFPWLSFCHRFHQAISYSSSIV